MCYINDRARDNGLIARTRPELDTYTGQKVYDFVDMATGELKGEGLVGRPEAYEWVIRYEEKYHTNTTGRA